MKNINGIIYNINDEYIPYFYRDQGVPGDERDINDINDVIIHSIIIYLPENVYKLFHKRKFYKSLDKEIVEAVWQPSRYLDFQELRDLKERWGEK